MMSTYTNVNFTTQVVDQSTFDIDPALRCKSCEVTMSNSIADWKRISKMTFTDQQSFIKKKRLCFKCLKVSSLYPPVQIWRSTKAKSQFIGTRRH